MARGVTLTDPERAFLTAEMQQSGMSARDIAFAFNPRQGLQTGLSYRAVKCIGGGLINDAFYPGAGHQWQMQLGSNYVYLEGDGTFGGMFVTAWN